MQVPVVLISKVDVKFQQEKKMHSHSLSITTLIWRPPKISFLFKLTEDNYSLQFPALIAWSLFSCFSFLHDNAHWYISWGGGKEDFGVFIPTCGLSCSTTQPHVSPSDSSLDSMLSDSWALPRFNGAVISATNSAQLIRWVSSDIAFLAMEQQYNQNTEHIIINRP